MRVRIRKVAVDPLPCGEISTAAFIGTSWQIDVATFRGQRDFEVRQDFEEIRYYIIIADTGCQFSTLIGLLLISYKSDKCGLCTSGIAKNTN